MIRASTIRHPSPFGITFRNVLLKTIGNDNDNPYPLLPALVGGPGNQRSRHGDYGKVHVAGHSHNRWIGLYPHHGIRMGVYRIRHSGKVVVNELLHQQLSDGSPLPGGPYHRHRTGVQPVLERRDRGGSLPLLLFFCNQFRPRNRKGEMEDAALNPARQVKTVVPEDAHHRSVVAQHIGLKISDSPVAGHMSQPFQQCGAETDPLAGILNGKGDFRCILICQTEVPSNRDNILPLFLR